MWESSIDWTEDVSLQRVEPDPQDLERELVAVLPGLHILSMEWPSLLHMVIENPKDRKALCRHTFVCLVVGKTSATSTLGSQHPESKGLSYFVHHCSSCV